MTCQSIRASKAHPRAGGENTIDTGIPLRSGGSSPRGRGKLPMPRANCLAERLIPARAGKT